VGACESGSRNRQGGPISQRGRSESGTAGLSESIRSFESRGARPLSVDAVAPGSLDDHGSIGGFWALRKDSTMGAKYLILADYQHVLPC